MTERTYHVNVNANAQRIFTLQANSGREALEKLKAEGHLYPRSGGWTLDFSGTERERFSVSVVAEETETWVGPGPNGEFEDERGSE